MFDYFECVCLRFVASPSAGSPQRQMPSNAADDNPVETAKTLISKALECDEKMHAKEAFNLYTQAAEFCLRYVASVTISFSYFFLKSKSDDQFRGKESKMPKTWR
jgi:hypothetical protein